MPTSFGFDLDVYCDNLRATKPPYECPIKSCGRIYKSYCGIRFHLYKFDHDNPDNNAPSPAPSDSSKKKKTKKGRGAFRRSPSPVEFVRAPGREPLTYAEAQRLVEIEFQGRVFRLDINEPLELVLQDEIDNQENQEKEERSKNKHHETPKMHKSVPQHTSAKLPEAQFKVLDDYAKPPPAPERPANYYRYIEKSLEELDSEVEYDMDEEDYAWLELVNQARTEDSSNLVTQDNFELLMDRFEKEAFFQSQSSGRHPESLIDEDAVCSICLDGECQNSNVILFCDMCNLAVHQECYGVPYIPEGQWLCRRCLQSPSCAVECCLCPNRGGAFKQTDDGRWAHVVCAFWIPEVGFANTVFLEPIDSIAHIPPARWKLSCYICKQRGAGACIQCHKTNCYTAFHVTCAQQAGLYMKIEPVRDATHSPSMAVRKTAFCDTHTPPDKLGTPMISNGDSDDEYFAATSRRNKISKLKMRKARKILAEKRNMMPVVSIPVISPKKIGAKVTLAKKQQFIRLLYSYWTLKRQSRNGVPLIRRLQTNHMSRNKGETKDDKESSELKEQLKYWQRLRQDLEKARLLVELIRKREKLKREHLRLKQLETDFRLQPFKILLRNCLDQVQAKDTYNIFADPVNLKEVPDYKSYIKEPMDFSTVRKRAESHRYRDMDAFERDFELIISNCMTYNARETLFYKAAVKMQNQGGAIIRATRRMMEKVGYDVEAGTHLDVAPVVHDDMDILEDIKDLLPPDVRADMPLKEQLRVLLDRMDLANQGQKTKLARQIKGEIRKVRKQLALKKGEKPMLTDDSASEDDCGPLPPAPLPPPPAPVLNMVSPRRRRYLPKKPHRYAMIQRKQKKRKMVQSKLNYKKSDDPESVDPETNKTDDSSTDELRSSERNSSNNNSSVEYQDEFLAFVQKKPRSPSKESPAKTKSSPKKKGGRGRKRREEEDETTADEKGEVDTGLEGGAEVAAALTNSDEKLDLPDDVSTDVAPTDNTQNDKSPPGNRRSAVLFGKKGGKNSPSKKSRQKSKVHVVQEPPSLDIPDDEQNKELPPLLEPAKVPKSPARRKRNASTAEDQPPEKARKTQASIVLENGPDLALPESPKLHSERDTPPVLKPQSPQLNPNSPSQRQSFFAYRTDRNMTSSESDTSSESSDVSETESSASGGSAHGDGQAPRLRDHDKPRTRSPDRRPLQNGPSLTCERDDESPVIKPAILRRTERGSASGKKTSYLVRHAKTKIWRELVDDVIPLEPLDLVWAKCRGYPWYPALIINPKMPKTGYFHNGVPIPVPPADVLTLQRKFDEPVYLVLFFDTKRTWQWLPRDKLEPLGVDSGLDDVKLNDQKRPQIRKSVRLAYEKAVSHRCRVTGEPNVLRLPKDKSSDED